jgi:hypothetical protein
MGDCLITHYGFAARDLIVPRSEEKEKPMMFLRKRAKVKQWIWGSVLLYAVIALGMSVYAARPRIVPTFHCLL